MKTTLLHSLLRHLVFILFSWLLTTSASAAGSQSAWIRVDTQTLTLTVYSGRDRLLARFHNISIGSGGTSILRRAGDEKTPLGVFHVAWINPSSPYRIFFGLDYPNAAHADRAYLLGLIDEEHRRAILRAARSGTLPPQDTPLGGHIGIHGVGAGDPAIHDSINWTDGCIALSNMEIARLAKWIRLGTRVEIQ